MELWHTPNVHKQDKTMLSSDRKASTPSNGPCERYTDSLCHAVTRCFELRDSPRSYRCHWDGSRTRLAKISAIRIRSNIQRLNLTLVDSTFDTIIVRYLQRDHRTATRLARKSIPHVSHSTRMELTYRPKDIPRAPVQR